jgi:O-antigen ligase
MSLYARAGFLLLALTPLAFWPGAFAHDDVLKRPLVATAACLLLIHLLSRWRAPAIELRRDPVVLPLLVAWSVCFLSFVACLLRGGNPYEAFWPLLLPAGGIVIYLGTSNLPGDEGFFREKLPRWVVGVACAVAAYGLLQRSGIDPLLSDPARLNPDSEPVSTLGGKTFAGEYQALIFPLALAIAATVSTGRGRVVAAGAVLLIGLHLLVTGARGAWLGAGAGTALFLALGLIQRNGPERQRSLSPAAVAAGFGMLLAAALLAQATGAADWIGRIRSGLAPPPGQDTGLVRRELWKSTLRMAADHPVLGVGPGQYALNIQSYRSVAEMRESDPRRIGREAGMAHNDFLQRLAETGALGAAAIVLVLFSLVRKSVAHLRGQGNREDFLLAAGLLSGAVAVAGAALLGNPFRQPAVGALAFLILGLAERMGNPAPQLRAVEFTPMRRGAACLALALLAPGFLLGWPLAAVDAMYARLLESLHASSRVGERVDEADNPRALRMNGYGALAEGSLQGLSSVCPGGWEMRRALGLLHLEVAGTPESLGKAVEHLAAAKALHPNDPESWNAWGRAMRIQGKRDEGRRAFERAVTLDPIVRTPRMNLALAYEQDGLYSQAARQYDTMIRLDPNDAAAHFGLGHALAHLGRHAEAAEAFSAAERTGYRLRGRDTRAEVLRMDSLRAFRDSEPGKVWLK